MRIFERIPSDLYHAIHEGFPELNSQNEEAQEHALLQH